jgi:dTDP-4-dehydrorhamnose reductase
VRILITGAAGQLGQELRAALAGEEVLPVDMGAADPTVAEMDITDYRRTTGVIEEFAPDVVIHGAAYTNVDGCEIDPDLAYRVNALGTQNVALACQRVDAALLYISTDYVFDGTKGTPYLEFDAPNPVSVYGRSKLAGEEYVRSLLRRFYVVRTAWLYGNGSKNFPKTILAAAARQSSLFGVVDEVGCPTWARDLAAGVAQLIRAPLYGVYHLTNEGYCSRFELVQAILELAGRSEVAITPLSAAAFNARYPLPAKRPAFTALRNYCAATALGIRLRPWREALAEFICSLR